MESIPVKQVRIFRSKEAIIQLLTEYSRSNLSIKAFCFCKNIPQASFHNWKKKYISHTVRPGKQQGFTALQITPSIPVIGPALFAEIKGIRIYQRVDAVYLKELLA